MKGREQTIEQHLLKTLNPTVASSFGRRHLVLARATYKLEGEVCERLAPDGQPKKMDIDTMHAYRDAIGGEQGRRVVDYAAILYPGPEVRFNEGLEALPAVPGMEQGLEARLGEVLAAALAGDAYAGAGAF